MMAESSENITAKDGKLETTPVASLGAVLREAREHMGLSVIDVANQIKFAPRQIEALEADEFKNLHEDAFLRGFVRSYAKILQLDPQPLFSAVSQTNEDSVEQKPVTNGSSFSIPISIADKNLNLLIAAALLVVVAGAFGLWNFISPLEQAEMIQVEAPVSLSEEVTGVLDKLAPSVLVEPIKPEVRSKRIPVQPEQAVKAKPKPKPKPKLKPKPVPKPAPKLTPEVKPVPALLNQGDISVSQPAIATPATQIRLEFGDESWTEIKDRNGTILSSQINPAGSELIIYGQAPFTMLIGNGLTARLYHKGKQVDLTPFINKYSEVAHVTLQ